MADLGWKFPKIMCRSCVL